MTQRIAIATDQTAPTATRPIFARLREVAGMVPNVYGVIGHSPGSLSSVLAWNEALASSGLSAREREQLNLHVSELNGCAYCVSAHAALGARAGLAADQIAGARVGVGGNPREQALLAFARRVVRTGGARAGTELARLREAGVSDAEIIDALAVVALNAFRNAVNLVAETAIDFPRAADLPSS